MWWVIPGALAATTIGYAILKHIVRRAIVKKMGLDAVMGNPPMVEEKEQGPWP